jgi:hypothetical protein
VDRLLGKARDGGNQHELKQAEADEGLHSERLNDKILDIE